MAGSACRTLIISAQRPALEAVPWTKTTGICPNRGGVSETSWFFAPTWNTLPKNPFNSRSQTGDSWRPQASAAVGSCSSGTVRPAITTVSVSDSG